MKLNKKMIQTIICILLLIIADTAKILEKRRIKISRNARSNAKAREPVTLILFGIQALSYIYSAYKDKKIIDEYKALKDYYYAANKLTSENQHFIKKFNGEKCLYYQRFDMLNKSIFLAFMVQKLKTATNNFSQFIETMTDDTKKTSSFMQKSEKAQKDKFSIFKKINLREKMRKRTNKKISLKSKKENLEKKLKEVEDELIKKIEKEQQELPDAYNAVEKGLASIQGKTNILINLYCNPNNRISHYIDSIQEKLKSEIEDVDEKIKSHISNSNFLGNIMQIGLWSSMVQGIDQGIEDYKKKLGLSELSPEEKEEENKKHSIEKFNDKLEIADSLISGVSSGANNLPASFMFKSKDLQDQYKSLKIEDLVKVINGETTKHFKEKFPNLTKEFIESHINKQNTDFIKDVGKVNSVSDYVGNFAFFTGGFVLFLSFFQNEKKGADEIETFKNKIDLFNKTVSFITDGLDKFFKHVPVFRYASSVKSVFEMIGKYLEYRNVVQYVQKKIGNVNELKNNIRMKTLKYMAREIHDRCDLLMHTTDVLTNNQNNFKKIFEDTSSTYIDKYIELKKQMALYTKDHQNNLSKEYVAEEKQFKEIEKSFMAVVSSNSAMVASESKIIMAYNAYIHNQFENTEKMETVKTFKLQSTYGPFNRLLIATSPDIYKAFLEVGYELIYYINLKTKGGELTLDELHSNFNFLMGCRACGDEIILDIYVLSLEEFENNKYGLKNISKSEKNPKINYLTYKDGVLVYSTVISEQKLIINPSNTEEKCLLDTENTQRAFIGIMNQDSLNEDIILHSSFWSIYCQDTFYRNDIFYETNYSYNQTIYDKNDKEKFKRFTRLNTDHKEKRYYLHVEEYNYFYAYDSIPFHYDLDAPIDRNERIYDTKYNYNFPLSNRNFKDDLEKTNKDEDEILITCVKRKEDSRIRHFCYYLKPIPMENDEFFKEDRVQIRSICTGLEYFDKLKKGYNFFGKTIIPITHFFNQDFIEKNAYDDSKTEETCKMFYADGEKIDIIRVKKNNSRDFFIIYEKDRVIKETKIKGGDSSPITLETTRSENNIDNFDKFSRSLNTFRNDICKNESICKNFFIDGNRRQMYESVSKELEIYNNLFIDDDSILALKKKMTVDKTPSDSSDYEYLSEKIDPENNNLPKVVDGMLSKISNGYFLYIPYIPPFFNNMTENTFFYKKEKKFIIPPLMKVYWNKESYSYIFSSEKNIKLSLKDPKLELTYNKICYNSILNVKSPVTYITSTDKNTDLSNDIKKY